MSSFLNHAGFPLPGDKAKEGSMPSVVSVLSCMDPGSLHKKIVAKITNLELKLKICWILIALERAC